MKFKSLSILTLTIFALFLPQLSAAQYQSDSVPSDKHHLIVAAPLGMSEKSSLIDSVSASWNSWEKVSLSGKFKMSGLPLSPSVKIYMERDSIILLSLRAPFVGEVGRAEITDSTILVVNKMNHTYVEDTLEKALAYYPGTISDIQDLLLGRIAVPGAGLLSQSTAEAVTMYAEDDGTITLMASDEFKIPGFDYGYVIDSAFNNRGLMVLPENNKDVVISLEYDRIEDETSLDFGYLSDKRNYKATLQLNQPEWDAKPFNRIKIGKQYRKLDFQDFISSAGK